LKSPWRSPSEGDLHGEIDVCENREIILFWWLVVEHLLARRAARVVRARDLEHLEMVRPPVRLMLERAIVAACASEFNSRLCWRS
jgi:hypothetical protein